MSRRVAQPKFWWVNENWLLFQFRGWSAKSFRPYWSPQQISEHTNPQRYKPGTYAQTTDVWAIYSSKMSLVRRSIIRPSTRGILFQQFSEKKTGSIRPTSSADASISLQNWPVVRPFLKASKALRHFFREMLITVY